MQHVGIDVSRSVLDITVYETGEYFQVENKPFGFEYLNVKLGQVSNICMEATGVYYRPLALFLVHNHHNVFVENPLKIKSFFRTKLGRVKTDKQDSSLIAEYLVKFFADIRRWDSAPESLEMLSLTVRFAESLTIQRVGVVNRLHAALYASPKMIPKLERVLTTLGNERQVIYDIALSIIESDPLLQKWILALVDISGFSDILAMRFLAHAKDLRRFETAKKFASFTGLTPSLYESGQMKLSSRISRLGSSRLRSDLFLAARAASRSKGVYGDYYRKLVSREKPKNQLCVL